MIVIGIYDGHNASASLSIDGKIICAIQEERFTKRKNETGFPVNVVQYLMNKYSLSNINIDIVAMSTIERTHVGYYKYPVDTVFSINDHIDMMNNYWNPKISGQEYSKSYIKDVFEKKYPKEKLLYEIPDSYYDLSIDERQKGITDITIDMVSKIMNIDKSKIKFYDHHTCHIMYGHYANTNKKDKTIGITIDAYGDECNQTIWMINKDKFELITKSRQCEIARLYKMVTLYLRMKPLEHEYKVMGLAPYSKDFYAKAVEEELDDLLQFDGLKIIYKNRPDNLYEHLQDKFKYHRFDNIAGGIQRYTEKMLVELFTRSHKKLDCTNFVFSGGVAMNVKANKVIGELPFIDNFFVAGSSSDESLSIGACYYVNNQHGIPNEPLKDLYLGNEITTKDFEQYVSKNKLSQKYLIKKTNNREIAKLLSENQVIARVSGRMEFGARALGNRSLLANPSNPSIIQYINELVKGRDFWMPFAATIMDSFANKYLHNPKNFESNFMSVAMDTKKDFLSDIKAGTHAYDESIRPQILTKDQNPEYYDLINEFSKITNIGALLNTSFNLHGKPIVSDMSDAIDVLDNSGLKYLVVNEYLLQKR